jgi:NADH:ubiquinone oxidoreductase subunit 5 (subunit L)/multisubunit Na+/H+ antiporter MnhA subunit
MSALVAALIVLPLLAGALIAATSRRISPSGAHRVTLTATGLTAVCALILLPHTGDGPCVAMEWLPGTGTMRLTAGATGLHAALVTTWGAFLVLLATTSRAAQCPPLSGAVTLLALAATNVAFLIDHFLGRYVALEITALCIALALLVQVRNPAGSRLARSSYLLLRLGDAGLLTAILILMDASGTLNIASALEAGSALDATRLDWAVGGFILAVWVKLAGWPFHLWGQPGRRLALSSQAWLYATVMPNLGAYLLYRVTPLLALAGPMQTAVLWMGAGGGALSALIALTRADLRSALVYLGAALGGLALFVAATGVKPAVWIGLLAVTPLRLLLFLAADAAQHSTSAARRRVAACLFGIGGLMLTAFGLLTTYWARQARAPLDALLVAEAAVALTGAWAARAAYRLSRTPPADTEGPAVHWTQWMTTGVLGVGVVATAPAFGSLTRHLAAANRMALPATPTLPGLLRYAVSAPALLVVTALVLAVWRLQWRLRLSPLVSAEPGEEVLDLEEGLARAAQVLHAVVEVGIAEQIVALVVRAVVDGARFTYRVGEHKGLEGLLRGSVRVVVDGAHVTYRVVEQGSLEGLLRRAVGSAMALGRGLQRWHTGRLRRNLLWVAVSLGLAVLALVLHGW